MQNDRLKYFYGVVLWTVSLFLTACGFHLQGEVKLAPPLHRLYIQSPDPYSNLVRNLQQALKMSHVQLVSSPQEAETILVIMQDSTTRELLGPSGSLQTSQYRLRVIVTFEITDAKGRTLVAPISLIEERPITIQSNQILGSSNEANLYFQQMRRSLAYAIMNRIASKEVTQTLMANYSSITSKKP